MPAERLPERPDLDQLKRQAKELLKAWKAAPDDARRLRNAQRAVAARYGFSSWDALRTHVEAVMGHVTAPAKRRRGLDYDDPIHDVITLSGPITPDVVERLREQGISGIKVDASVPPATLAHLAALPALQRLDLSHRDDLVDSDLAFLEAMPQLTAVSLASCRRLSDAAVAFLARHQALEQINLQWTGTGDAAVAALVNKLLLTRVVVGGLVTDAGAAHLREFPALAFAGADDSFLSVSSARSLTDQALVSIGQLAGVVALDVHMSVFGSPHYTERGVMHLRGMTSLEELNFHGPLATDAVLRAIAAIPRLRHLHCQDIASGDEGFLALAERSTLEVLGGRVCPRLTDRGFAAIARLPRLKSVGVGGPRVTDAAMSAIADAPALEDIGPILFGDDAFQYIARIPKLRRLSNMYNRATTDAATRHLRDHQTLVEYSAFGTQITDESLRVLSGIPTIEKLEFESCGGITDEGMRAVARLPRLRRVSVWDCVKVSGGWVDSVGVGVEAKSELGAPGHAAGYRAETLMDYPNLPIPPDAEAPAGHAPPGALSTLVSFGPRAQFVDGVLQLEVPPGTDTRWIGLLTREAFAVPLLIELVVRPITELRLAYGGHNRLMVFDEFGYPADPAPWFTKVPEQQGRAHRSGEPRKIPPDEWARVTLEIDERERRVFVNGELRQSWQDDFTATRGRVALSLRRSSLAVRQFSVGPLRR